MSSQLTVECQVVHPDGLEVEINSGSMTRLAGVSQALGGAEGIHLAIATIPPGCASSPHYHVNCESAIYVSRGKGRFLTGINLEKSLDIAAGDFIYVPPDSVHQPVNDSLSETMELIVARNAPVEIVVEFDPETGKPAE
ncbi:MAG: cupin domain-containing protein [Dehalococcoidia bacterium]|nr:cupin domain-containing protein [Dehalococcoidia bacterium]